MNNYICSTEGQVPTCLIHALWFCVQEQQLIRAFCLFIVQCLSPSCVQKVSAGTEESCYITKTMLQTLRLRFGVQSQAEIISARSRQAGRHASASLLLSRNMDSTDHVDLPLCCVSVPCFCLSLHHSKIPCCFSC